MSANLLTKRLSEAKRKKEKLLCVFLTLGFPSLKATEKMIQICEAKGVDIVELGFPFSDPLADGPTIQFSSEKALKNKVQIQDAFRMVRRLRKKGCRIPILFFSYLNPIFAYGEKEFVKTAKKSGLDGLIIPDLPPEEESVLQRECKRQKFSQVFLIAPTTPKSRAKKIAQKSQGFIYYVSLKGVTGARPKLPKELKSHLGALKKISKKPFLVGFGVSKPEQARKLVQTSHGVIVGSAVIDQLRRSQGLKKAERFIDKMVKAIKK